MRFDTHAPHTRPVVAYLDSCGDLTFPVDGVGAVCIMKDGEHYTTTWDPDCESVKHRFYVGDKLTISF